MGGINTRPQSLRKTTLTKTTTFHTSAVLAAPCAITSAASHSSLAERLVNKQAPWLVPTLKSALTTLRLEVKKRGHRPI